MSLVLTRPEELRPSIDRRRAAIGITGVVVTTAVGVFAARRLTHTSWPFQNAHLGLVGAASALYLASFILRAFAWQGLFPASSRPARARCLAACGAAAASGVILPFRMDYLVKIGTLRKIRGVKLGLEAIALSIVSLGIVDAIAFLPLSISAAATSSDSFRGPLLLVVLFGIGACGVLAAGNRILHISILHRRPRLSRLAKRAAELPRASAREIGTAWILLVGCWTSRALASALLLAALGAGFTPSTALILLCLAAAAALIPITSGGMVANVGATAAILLALGVDREQAINFGLASGLLLCAAALVAGAIGAGFSYLQRNGHAARLALETS